MSAIRKILVPVDFGEASEHSLDQAIELARTHAAEVLVLNVWRVQTVAPVVPMAVSTSILDTLAHASREGVDRLVQARAACGVKVRGLSRVGLTRDVILAVAEEIGADLIVMATHGRRGVSRLVMGSVAESIVRRSPRPVLTVHAAQV
jgi:universal stress protein A